MQLACTAHGARPRLSLSVCASPQLPWHGGVGPPCSASIDPVTFRPPHQGLDCVAFALKPRQEGERGQSSRGSFGGPVACRPLCSPCPRPHPGSLASSLRAESALPEAVCLQPAVPAEGAIPLEVLSGSPFILLGCPSDKNKMFALAICLALEAFRDDARALDENGVPSLSGWSQRARFSENKMSHTRAVYLYSGLTRAMESPDLTGPGSRVPSDPPPEPRGRF